jgi:hypothetical protein
MSFSGLKTAVLRARDQLLARPGRADRRGPRRHLRRVPGRRGRCSGRQDGSGARGAAGRHRACRGRRRRGQRHLARPAGRGGGAGGAAAFAPPLALCTDNAAMIAYAGLLSHEAGVSATRRLPRGRAGRSTRRGPAWSGRDAKGPRHDAAGGLRRGRLRVRACDDLCGGGPAGHALGAGRRGSHRRNPRDAPPSGPTLARQRPRDVRPADRRRHRPDRGADAIAGRHVQAVHPRAPVLVSCAKGIDMATGLGPAALVQRHAPGARWRS